MLPPILGRSCATGWDTVTNAPSTVIGRCAPMDPRSHRSQRPASRSSRLRILVCRRLHRGVLYVGASIPRGTTVAGVEIGGMSTADEATQALDRTPAR